MLIARRLRFSWPGYLVFAAPAAWLGVWTCVGIPTEHWLLNDVMVNIAILLVLYCLCAWLAAAAGQA